MIPESTNKNSNAGFTLLEVIAAVFVLTVGVLAAYSVVSRVLSTTHSSANRLTAAYLAKEGIEIVRNIRDTNWLNVLSWNNGLVVGDYEADYNDNSLTPFGSLSFLKIDGGFYNYGNGNNTPFKRKINIGYPNTDDCLSSNCLTVRVEVTWQEKGETKGPIRVIENLYNWGD